LCLLARVAARLDAEVGADQTDDRPEQGAQEGDHLCRVGEHAAYDERKGDQEPDENRHDAEDHYKEISVM
jgi:hypothetical protein